MYSKLSAYLCGLLFGLGLIVSGMADPAKVLGFLDLAGAWDPSLALVMAGAIGVALIAFRLVRNMPQALCGGPMQLPSATRITPRLLIGSGLFGIGWGIAGICPGPALVLLGAGQAKGLLFVLAMLAGMAIFHFLERTRSGGH